MSAVDVLEASSPTLKTSTKADRETSHPCRLLDLPAELRNRIYELAFSTETETNLLEAVPPPKHLLLACRQIYQEAVGLHKIAFRSYWADTRYVLNHANLSDTAFYPVHFTDEDPVRVSRLVVYTSTHRMHDAKFFRITLLERLRYGQDNEAFQLERVPGFLTWMATPKSVITQADDENDGCCVLKGDEWDKDRRVVALSPVPARLAIVETPGTLTIKELETLLGIKIQQVAKVEEVEEQRKA